MATRTNSPSAVPQRLSDRHFLIAVAGVAVISVLFSFWIDVSYLRDIAVFALLALSLDLFWGRTGILSFGHAAFFGLGAYGMAITTVYGMPPEGIASVVGMLAGVSLAGLVALVVGYFLIYGNVRGAFFTIVTMAMALVAQYIAIGWSKVTGGDSGLVGVPALGVGSYVVMSPMVEYILISLVLLAAVMLAWWLMRGKKGLVFAALTENELKAQTMGYNTAVHLLGMFVVSAMLAGVAGAFYAAFNGFVAPDMIGLLLSTEIIIWVAIGGAGTLIGPVVGAALVWYAQQQLSSISTAYWPLAMGLLFILSVFLLPQGLAFIFHNRRRRIRTYPKVKAQ